VAVAVSVELLCPLCPVSSARLCSALACDGAVSLIAFMTLTHRRCISRNGQISKEIKISGRNTMVYNLTVELDGIEIPELER
jgi:hypothetical protein